MTLDEISQREHELAERQQSLLLQLQHIAEQFAVLGREKIRIIRGEVEEEPDVAPPDEPTAPTPNKVFPIGVRTDPKIRRKQKGEI